MTDFKIRLYEKRDRDAVRQICCDTAYRGQPIEKFFTDREIVAELLTGYYTDFEADSLWVAEYEGKIVGYLTGCRNNRHYAALLAWPIVPRMIWKAVLKGLFYRKMTWRLLWTTIRNWQIGGFSKYIPWERHSGHLHIDIMDQFRGQHVGRQLMERFMQQAQESNLRGVYAVTYEDNIPACRFFERMGFDVISRHHRILPEGESDQMHQILVFRRLLI